MKKILSIFNISIIFFLLIVNTANSGWFDCDNGFGITTTTHKSNNSNFFNPKIRVESRFCFGCLGCLHDNFDLGAMGDCNWLHGLFGRVCARPFRTASSTQDGKITYDCTKSEGAGEDPPPPDCNKYDWNFQHICVYNDLPAPFDTGDFTWSKNPIPKNYPVDSTIIDKILASLGIDNTIGRAASYAVLTATNPAFIPIIAILETLIQIQEYIPFLNHVNHNVGDNIGCVRFPLAPYPPPFTPELQSRVNNLFMYNICKKKYSYDNNGVIKESLQQSETDNICEQSYLTDHSYTSFSSPILRVGYNDIVQNCESVAEEIINRDLANKKEICSNSSTSDSSLAEYLTSCAKKTSDLNKLDIIKKPVCVKFANISKFNTSTKKFIKKCKSDDCNKLSNENEPCVCFPNTPTTNQGLELNNQDLYRVLYKNNLKSQNNISNNDLFGSPSLYHKEVSSNSEFYGVIYSKVQDTIFSFPDNDNEVTLSKNITDILGTPANYKIFNKKNSDDICVKDAYDSIIGCMQRPNMAKPNIVSNHTEKLCPPLKSSNEDCTTPNQIIKSTITRPVLYASFGDTKKATKTIQYDPNSKNEFYVMGKKFSLFVTDKNYSTVDYDGNLYGKYRKKDSLEIFELSKEDKKKIINNQALDSNYIYVDGLEYRKGKYTRGGEYICLNGYQNDQKIVTIQEKLTSAGEEVTNIAPQASLKNSLRIYPKPKIGKIDDYYVEDQFKDFTTLTANSTNNIIFGTNLAAEGEERRNKLKQNEVIRHKNPMEHGLCGLIPKPKCQKLTSEDGTQWEESPISTNLVYGKCLIASSNKPQRLCQANGDNALWSEVLNQCKGWWPSDDVTFGQYSEYDSHNIGFRQESVEIKFTNLIVLKDLTELYKRILSYNSLTNDQFYNELKNGNTITLSSPNTSDLKVYRVNREEIPSEYRGSYKKLEMKSTNHTYFIYERSNPTFHTSPFGNVSIKRKENDVEIYFSGISRIMSYDNEQNKKIIIKNIFK